MTDANVFTGTASHNGKDIVFSIVTSKPIPSTLALTASMVINYIRGNGIDLTSRATWTVTAARSGNNAILITLTADSQVVSPYYAYGVWMRGTITFT